MGQVQDKQREVEVESQEIGAGDAGRSEHSPVKRKPKKGKGKKKARPTPKVEITEPAVAPKSAVKIEAKKPLSPKQEKIETNIDDVLDSQDLATPSGSDTDKENMMVHTPQKPIVVHEVVTPMLIQPDNMPTPNATSTPAVNGPPASQTTDSESDSEEDSESESEADSSQEVDSSGKHHSLPNYGKFYQSSYLRENCINYMKRPTASTGRIAPHKNFSRPDNFTYEKEPPAWVRKSGGMMALASGKGVKVLKVRAASPIQPDLKNAEVLRLSMYPAAKPPQPNEVVKIEREDWPGPPSPAALLPEIIRERKRNRGEPLYDDDEDLAPQEDPKVAREISELSKFQDESSITKVILKDLHGRRALLPVPLNPWKASRAPSAKYEPKIQTRHLSPMFASPSRFIDRPRPRSWDDHDIGYRSLSIPHYAKYPEAKPGYGSWQPRSATLPLSGYYGGQIDYSYYEFDDQGLRREKSTHTSTSTVNTESSLKRDQSSIFEGSGPSMSLLRIQQGSWHTATVPPIYDYERLKITNFDLPKDVDRNLLEIHLTKEQFEAVFNMTREEFYKFAEWKRNDIKRRHHLY